MRQLEQETNVEVLRQYSTLLISEVKRLSAALTVAGSQEPTWLEKDLRDQLSKLQKRFFGFGRESLEPRGDRPTGKRFEQLKLHGEHHQPEEETADKSPAKPLSLPEIILHPLNEAGLKAESESRELGSDAKPWKEMKNFYQDSVEVTVTERVYTKVIHRQLKYKLKDEYNTSDKDVIITAPGPVKVKAGCHYSVDFALSVISDKYEYHLPLERQRRKMEAAGLDVDVKTLYGLCEAVAGQLGPVVENIRQDIMNDFCAVHIDESPWLIITEKHRGQMWAMSNRIGSYYRFEPTRSGAIAEEMLKGYEGAVLTDALAAYNRLKYMEGVRKGLCWAHVRREFYERMDDFPEAETMVRMIDELFDIEAKAKTFAELGQLRALESRAVVMLMEAWLLEQSQRHLPSDGIMKAINYAANHWTHLLTFLRDLSLPLSNNDAERALRHVVLGRKNFAGSKTINGADVAATLYTVIESAKKVGLQPKDYLKYVITENWHGRKPKSPKDYSTETLGINKRVVFPHKDQWHVPPISETQPTQA